MGPVGYDYDARGNLTPLTLPDGRKLNQLHYGSGHLHQINLDGLLISDFERDALHRETLRTQGSLTSRFGYDARGRKAWQAAIQLPHEQLSQFTREAGSLLGHPEHPATVVHRKYHYSPGGELQRVTDKHRGTTDYKLRRQRPPTQPHPRPSTAAWRRLSLRPGRQPVRRRPMAIRQATRQPPRGLERFAFYL